jgi:hypothetical protein
MKVENWMKYDQTAVKAVNASELLSISALIKYVAHISKQNEFRVERQFADHFSIPNVKCLPAEHYEAAIRYLVDQVPVDVIAAA